MRGRPRALDDPTRSFPPCTNVLGAPAIRYPVRASRAGACAAGAAALAGAASCTAWALAQPHAPWPLAAAVWAGGAAWAWRAQHRAPRGTLAWDGLGWTWEPEHGEPAPAHLGVALDAQTAVLIRTTARPPASGAPPRWLWLERRHAPTLWDALRRAVYSRAAAAPPAAGAPLATPAPAPE